MKVMQRGTLRVLLVPGNLGKGSCTLCFHLIYLFHGMLELDCMILFHFTLFLKVSEFLLRNCR